MSQEHIDQAIERDYAAGFISAIESDTLPPGLDEDVIRFISGKKNAATKASSNTYKHISSTIGSAWVSGFPFITSCLWLCFFYLLPQIKSQLPLLVRGLCLCCQWQ